MAQTTDTPAPWWADDHRPASAACEAVLTACREQIAAWGLTMPKIEPDVIDFGLGDFRETGIIMFTIVNETDAGYCGKFLFVLDEQTCPYHRHATKHETFFVVRGRVTMTIDGEERTMSAGDVLPLTPGVKHSFTGRGNALLLEVSMPSSGGDNFFEDRRIGRDGVV